MPANKVRCPFHEDHTASLHFYYNEDHYHCFGCGAHGVLSTLLGESVVKRPHEEKPKEDLEASLARIKALPTKEIRGLQLPYDDKSYYIVWPNCPYYSRRFFEVAEGMPKYKRPSGHPTPLLNARTNGTPLVIIEGELNALSVALAVDSEHSLSLSIVSPGSAGDFYSKGRDSNLDTYCRYPHIVLLVDADKAGTIAAIELKTKLTLRGHKNVSIHLMKKDANAILVEDGKERLKQYLTQVLALS